MATYAERVLSYAQRVVEGHESAGKYEVLACKRYLRDLVRQDSSGFPYNFPYKINERAGSRECQFIELLSHIKGEWARPIYVDGKLTYAKIALEDWQVFNEFNLFAWVHVETGLRRFRHSDEETVAATAGRSSACRASTARALLRRPRAP